MRHFAFCARAARILFAVAACAVSAARADVLCGTWNLRWFPSGRAEHRAPPALEARAIADAADTVRRGVEARAKGAGVVLFFQEVRDAACCSNLIAATGRKDLHLAVASAFRERDRRLGWQQLAVATSLPVVEASWSDWKREGRLQAPRGVARVVVDAGEDGLVACYCVHLKSDYGARNDPRKRAENAAKRRLAARQLVAFADRERTRDGRPVKRVVVAGDFNADVFGDHAGEETFAVLERAGFAHGWTGAPFFQRATFRRRSTIDYVYQRGFPRTSERGVEDDPTPSDHHLAWLRLCTKASL